MILDKEVFFSVYFLLFFFGKGKACVKSVQLTIF